MPGKRHSRFHYNKSATIIWSLLILRLVVLSNLSFAQRMKIDSLREMLSGLEDSARVDCMNSLALSFTYSFPDSAMNYSNRAMSEAIRVGYNRGIVMALNNQARIAGFADHDFVLQEKISHDVIGKHRLLWDKGPLIETYQNLALALFMQGKFDAARDVCATVDSLATSTSNKKARAEATIVKGSIELETGNYGDAFEYFNEGLKMFKEVGDSYNTAIVLVKLGDLYRLAGDHQGALDFYTQSLEYATGTSLLWNPLVDLGDISYSVDLYDSNSRIDEQYLQVIKSLTVKSSDRSISRTRKAEQLMALGSIDSALLLLRQELEITDRKRTPANTMRVLWNVTKIYSAKKEFDQAFDFARQLMTIAKAHKAKQYILYADWQFHLIHDQMNSIDSAYHYYRQYTRMKDEIALDQFGKRLAIYKAVTENEKQQNQIELLSREKLIGAQQLQLSEQLLRNESNLRKAIFTGGLALMLFGFIVIRNISLKQKNEAHRREIAENELSLQRMEAERTKSELQQKATELEMQALRAQMNPHFIFNSLSSINRFILQNNRNHASEYLTKFSRLMRLILQNSQVPLITLESELDALKLYLELEAVRFEHHFSYKIAVENGLDIVALKVPPLVIQPFVENAIWHGLMHKEDKGKLTVELFEQSKALCCKITDDGVGRARAREFKSKSANPHKSMGMRITAERISLLKSDANFKTSITINDLVLPDGNAGGTEVFLKLPLIYD